MPLCYLLFISYYAYMIGDSIIKPLIPVSGSRLSKPLLGAVAGFGVIATLLFFVGVMGLLYVWPIRIFVLLTFILLAWRRIKNDTLSLYGFIKEINWWQPLSFYIIIIVVCAYILVNTIRCLSPVTHGDSLTVYLHHANLFVKHNTIYNINYGGISASYRPLNALMLNAFGIIIHSDILSQLITGWLMGVLCLVSVYVLSRQFFGRKTSMIAALIFYTMPALPWLISNTKIDLCYAVFEISFWVLFVKWFKTKGNKINILLVSGVMLGFALGTKYHALFSCVFIGLLVFIVLLKKQENTIRSIGIVLLFALVVTAVGAPSYIRSWVLSGDPVYPFLTKGNCSREFIIGEDIPQDKAGYLLTHYQIVFGNSFPLANINKMASPIGVLAILFVPFAFLYGFKKKENRMLMAVFLVYYFYLTFIFSITSETYTRHFLPAITLLVIFGTHGIQWFRDNFGETMLNTTVILALIPTILLSNIGIGSNSRYKFKQQIKYVSGIQTKQNYLDNILYNQAVTMNSDMVNHFNHLEEKSVVFALDETPGYYIDIPIIQVRESRNQIDATWLKKIIGKHNITHLYYSEKRMETLLPDNLEKLTEVINEFVQDEKLDLVFESSRQYLYEVMTHLPN